MVYKNVPDIELWQQCQANDLHAYNELFSRYLPKLLRLASRYIKDEMLVEELCMDQLYVLWDKRHSISIRFNFSNYLFRAMRNRVMNQLRKNIVLLSDPALAMNAPQLTGTPADYQLLSDEADLTYQQALNELSPQRRKVFLLSREENLSYREIAQELSLSVNTVENYMTAALVSLRKVIKTTFLLSVAGQLFRYAPLLSAFFS
jgi:RNA polymerase sigma-70 factor (ECF subfamily)